MSHKTRSTRLRKKLRVDEFQELGFEISCAFSAINMDQMNTFFEQWIAFVISQTWEFGGGCSITGLSGFLTKPYRASMTEHDIAAAKQWLQARSEVQSSTSGELVDAWH